MEQYVVVQVGQCGNQVGCSLFEQLARDVLRLAAVPEQRTPEGRLYSATVPRERRSEIARSIADPFFRPGSRARRRQDPSEDSGPPNNSVPGLSGGGSSDDWIARAVLIDMEPKVVQECTVRAAASKVWRYDERGTHTEQSGSGNNWAHGFHSHAPRHREEMLRLIQREVDRCDCFAGFFVLLSLAGGTGSGLGTFVCEMLRDEFPGSMLVVQPVWPFRSGEVAVQCYNTVLSLARLQQSVDAMLITENDEVQRVCNRMHGVDTVSFDVMNGVIADTLASAVVPVIPVGTGHTTPVTFSADLLPHLCSHEDFKMLSARSVPQMTAATSEFATDNWRALSKRLYQMAITGASSDVLLDWNVSMEQRGSSGATAPRPTERICRCIANTVLSRGIADEAASSGKPNSTLRADLSAFRDDRLYAEWVSGTGGMQSFDTAVPYSGRQRSLTLVTNSQACMGPLEDTLERASVMFGERAYFHQYEAHGLSADDVVESLVATEHVLQQYRGV
jgi:tubulin delta